MSIAGISASNLFQSNFAQAAQDRFQRIQSQFKQLGQDLQSGDLTQAQADFATLAKELPRTQPQSQSATGDSTTTSAIAQAFKALGQDVQAGNLSAAQQDFAAIQQDAQQQPARQTHHHHHRHHAASSTPQGSGPISQDFGAWPGPAIWQSLLRAASLHRAATGFAAVPAGRRL
jgi:hypothetical protein